MLVNGDYLIVAQPLGDTVSTLHHLLAIELIVTGAAVMVALLGGLWLVRIGLKPLRVMEATAESIADGNLTERVPGENDSTEVGRLARTLNVMLNRIETAFRARVASEERLRDSEGRLRRFVADASHELRTPIAAISAYAELFGRGASEQKEDLERLMGGIRNETGRMEHLVSDLLLLARLDEGRPLELRSVDLVSLGADAVHTAMTVGPSWPVTFEASQPIEVIGRRDQPPPGRRQPARQRPGPHPGGDHRAGVGRARGRRGDDLGGRHRPGHGPGRGRAHLRALLPLGSEPVAAPRRRRSRALHRERHRGRPRGNRVGPERPGEGTTFTVHLPTAPPVGAAGDVDGAAPAGRTPPVGDPDRGSAGP